MRTEQQRLEAFGKPDPETGELVVDRVLEKKDLIEQGVRILHEIETLKSDIKEILEYGKERGYDKKLLKKTMDNVFKNEISEKIAELRVIELEIANIYG